MKNDQLNCREMFKRLSEYIDGELDAKWREFAIFALAAGDSARGQHHGMLFCKGHGEDQPCGPCGPAAALGMMGR